MSKQRALIVGAEGGVGRALLALLEHTRPGWTVCADTEAVLLLDRAAPSAAPVPAGCVQLPPASIESGDDLGRLIREHGITQVIDVSPVDTLDGARVSDAAGADFLCASSEEWPGHEPMPTDAAIARLLSPSPTLTHQSHLVGSGANPGIVNALAVVALDEFARRVGVSPTAEALELHGLLITEEDTTTDEDAGSPGDVFGMTWSPEHCLEELLEPRAFAAARGQVVGLGHEPTSREYSARCGGRIITGFAVPHEEVITLARRFPTVEIAFVYRLPGAARLALRSRRDRRRPELWPTRRLYPPWAVHLMGEDRLGVLLCSRRYGELWAGFETRAAAGLALGTNATQLQVAAGVLAGWSQLGRVRGIHFVEDLDCRQYVRSVVEVLGPPHVEHDAAAPPALLADRVPSVRPSERLPATPEVLGVRRADRWTGRWT